MRYLIPMDNYAKFVDKVWKHYEQNGRVMPWRQNTDPYAILVSEIMLQQTQVARVEVKFRQFLQLFPDVFALAHAPQSDVVAAWSGLGYNRRARFIHSAARIISEEWGGEIPNDHTQLVRLPGIGTNTAAAIIVYAFNEPLVFIETNIRTVYIHQFFSKQETVADSDLLPHISATVDQRRPREWYWALMDYGSFLKQEHKNPGRRSKHYARQSQFKGSTRELRGLILKLLIEQSYSQSELKKLLPDQRLEGVITQLISEKLIQKKREQISLVD